MKNHRAGGNSKKRADRVASLIALFEQGKFTELQNPAKLFLAEFPNEARINYILGASLVQTGQERSAFKYAQKAFDASQDNAVFAYLLAYLYVQIGLYEEALPLLQMITVSSSSRIHFQGHDLIGRLYFEIGDKDLAIKHTQLAIQLAPNSDVADKMRLKLAQFFLFASMNDEGFACIEEIKRNKSQLPHKALWLAAAFDPTGINSPYVASLKINLGESKLTDDEQIETLLLLGRLNEKAKNYSAAYEDWKSARQISLRKDIVYRNYDQALRQQKDFYTPALYNAIAEYRHDSDELIFVVGMPRSGTTLTEQILSSHSRIGGAGELARFNRIEAAFRSEYSDQVNFEGLIENARNGELCERADETLRILRLVAGSHNARIIEKTPHHFESIGFQMACFKNVKVIHCRRNPLDTFISSYQNDMNVSHGYAYDQKSYLSEYLWQEATMDYWKELFPSSIMTVYYEELVDNPEKVSRRLIDFAGMEWEEACLNFFERKNIVRTFSVQQVRSPVYSSSVQKWRNYRSELSSIIDELHRLKFSYPYLDYST